MPEFALRRLLACLLLGGVFLPASPVLASAVNELAQKVVAPDILLAQTYRSEFDPALYLVSEKLDGVRAIWDGRQLRFRSGRLIHAPAWFLQALPARALDGELWMGRRSFERLSAAVRRQQPDDEQWRQIQYHVYELPDAAGSFAERVEALQQLVAQANAPFLQVVAQQRIATPAALQMRLAQVLHAGGEGLMLHRQDALWQTGRSEVLLKLKAQHDAEALVVAHEKGRGKYQGMLGALVLQTADGQRFRVGSGLNDAMRRNPPAPGSMVTYRYRDLTAHGQPRFASFVRVHEAQ